MFKKQEEVTEGQLLRNALRHKGTKISVEGPNGKRWTFCNDTAADIELVVTGINITESGDKMDVVTKFNVRAKNGRLG